VPSGVIASAGPCSGHASTCQFENVARSGTTGSDADTGSTASAWSRICPGNTLRQAAWMRPAGSTVIAIRQHSHV